MKKKAVREVVIYQAKDGAIELRGDFERETVWATLDQIATVFGRDKSVISRHLRNIFTDGELYRNSVVAKNATTAADGKVYQVEYYNLDAIISVGYRVNSKKATQFRQWATKTLREHITRGYTLNRKQIGAHYDEFLKAVGDMQVLLPESVARLHSYGSCARHAPSAVTASILPHLLRSHCSSPRAIQNAKSR